MVLSRLPGSGAMLVLLHDSIEVLSKPAGNRPTPEMKNYTLKILSLRAKLPFLIVRRSRSRKMKFPVKPL